MAPPKPVIKWYATSGKEKGMLYPGEEWTDRVDCSTYWQENGQMTRTIIDSLPRPIGSKDLRPTSTSTELEASWMNGCHVPAKYMSAHQSASGWNLDVKNPRHLLRFPTEVLEIVLSHCVEYHGTVQPLCVQDNYIVTARLPTYRSEPEQYEVSGTYISYGKGGRPVKRNGQRTRLAHKRNGKSRKSGTQLGQLVKVHKRPIDATVLRVCKLFHTVGSKILYGKNKFTFNYCLEWDTGRTYPGEPMLWCAQTNGNPTVYKYSRNMPKLSLLGTPNIQEDIDLLMSQHDIIPSLSDWTWIDPFARFLKCAGSYNVGLLKNFHFVGEAWLPGVNAVEQDISFRGYRYPNVLYYIRAYSHLFERHCPNLRKLEITITEFAVTDFGHPLVPRTDYADAADKIIDVQFAALESQFSQAEARHRNEFTSLLEEVIPRLKNLQQLVVRSNRLCGRGRDSEFPKEKDSQAHKDLFNSWTEAADDEMTRDAKKYVAARYRQRNKHSDLVKWNERAGMGDSLEADRTRRLWLTNGKGGRAQIVG